MFIIISWPKVDQTVLYYMPTCWIWDPNKSYMTAQESQELGQNPCYLKSLTMLDNKASATALAELKLFIKL